MQSWPLYQKGCSKTGSTLKKVIMMVGLEKLWIGLKIFSLGKRPLGEIWERGLQNSAWPGKNNVCSSTQEGGNVEVSDGRLRRKRRGLTPTMLQGISMLMAIVRYWEDFCSYFTWLQLWCWLEATSLLGNHSFSPAGKQGLETSQSPCYIDTCLCCNAVWVSVPQGFYKLYHVDFLSRLKWCSFIPKRRKCWWDLWLLASRWEMPVNISCCIQQSIQQFCIIFSLK